MSLWILLVLSSSQAINKVLIFDAGSSSTRVYVYQYTNASDPSSYQSVMEGNKTMFFKGDYKLADVAKDEQIMDKIYEQLLTKYTNLKIPESEQPNIPLFIYGTAGMRLLSKEDQERVMNIAYKKAKEGFKYKVDPKYIRVIEGYEEGLFAWIALNRLRDAFGPQPPTLPVFEIGGASAQIATEIELSSNDAVKYFTHNVKIGVSSYNVFCHSWLGYGGDQAVKSVHTALLKQGTHQTPCTLVGANITLKINGTEEVFFGEADFDKCYELFTENMFKKVPSDQCGGYPCIFLDESLNKCVPLPKNFSTIYAQGVPALSAEFLEINTTMTITDYTNTSRWFSKFTYDEAKNRSDHWKNYSYMDKAFAQQILVINFVKRGFEGLVENLLIKAPVTINDVEPQWTLGAVMVAISDTISIKKPFNYLLYIVLPVSALVVIILIVLIIFIIIKKPKDDKFQSVDTGALI